MKAMCLLTRRFLDLNTLKKSISELDYEINIFESRRKILEKLKQRGGLVVVADADTAITTYTYQ